MCVCVRACVLASAMRVPVCIIVCVPMFVCVVPPCMSTCRYTQTRTHTHAHARTHTHAHAHAHTHTHNTHTQNHTNLKIGDSVDKAMTNMLACVYARVCALILYTIHTYCKGLHTHNVQTWVHMREHTYTHKE